MLLIWYGTESQSIDSHGSWISQIYELLQGDFEKADDVYESAITSQATILIFYNLEGLIIHYSIYVSFRFASYSRNPRCNGCKHHGTA